MWFDSILQLELQDSALELGKAVSPTHEVDKETVASLFLSVIMASHNFVTLCKTFWSQVRTCLDADEDDQNEEFVRFSKKSQAPLPHCEANLCHSCRLFRVARAACSGKDRHGVVLQQLWMEFEVKSVRRLRSTSVKKWDLFCGVRGVATSHKPLRSTSVKKWDLFCGVRSVATSHKPRDEGPISFSRGVYTDNSLRLRLHVRFVDRQGPNSDLGPD